MTISPKTQVQPFIPRKYSEFTVEEMKKEIIEDICSFCTTTINDDWEYIIDRYSLNPLIEELDESIESVQISCQLIYKK